MKKEHLTTPRTKDPVDIAEINVELATIEQQLMRILNKLNSKLEEKLEVKNEMSKEEHVQPGTWDHKSEKGHPRKNGVTGVYQSVPSDVGPNSPHNPPFEPSPGTATRPNVKIMKPEA